MKKSIETKPFDIVAFTTPQWWHLYHSVELTEISRQCLRKSPRGEKSALASVRFQTRPRLARCHISLPAWMAGRQAGLPRAGRHLYKLGTKKNTNRQPVSISLGLLIPAAVEALIFCSIAGLAGSLVVMTRKVPETSARGQSESGGGWWGESMRVLILGNTHAT